MENGVVEEIEPNQYIFSKQEIRKSLSLKDLVSTIGSFRFKLEPHGSHPQSVYHILAHRFFEGRVDDLRRNCC